MGIQKNLIFFVSLIFSFIENLRRFFYGNFLKVSGEKKIPSIRKVFPFGHLWYQKLFESRNVMLTYHMQYLYGVAKLFENEGMFEHYVGLRAGVMLTSPENAQILLKSKTELRKSPLYNTPKIALGEGLVTASGDSHWKFHRKAISPTFNHKMLEQFQVIMNMQASRLCDKLSKYANREPFEIYQYLVNSSFYNILESATGTDLAENKYGDTWLIKKTERFLNIWMERNFRIWLSTDAAFNMSALGKEAHRLAAETKISINKMINERRSVVQMKFSNSKTYFDDQTTRPCFIDSLILQQMSNEKSFADADIVDEVLTMLCAGFETVGTALNFLMFLVGNYPDVQRKIHAELDEIFGKEIARDITTSDVNQMKYLACAIKETLRLHPSAPIIFRELKEDLIINGSRIPKGTDVSVFIGAIQMHPAHFKDPEHFEPERFLPENASKLHPYAFIPFSAGLRNCIGLPFAMKFMLTVSSSILRKYRIESVETRDKMNVTWGITAKSNKPILIRCFERNL